MSTEAAPASDGFAPLVTDARLAVGKAVTEPLWQLSSAGLVEGTRELAELRAQVDGALLALTAEAVSRGSYLEVALKPGGWVRALTRFSPQESRRFAELAGAGRRHPGTVAALVAGEASAVQGSAIVDALDAVATVPGVDDALRGQAEDLLLGQASVLDPVGLRQVGAQLRRTLAARVRSVDDPAEAAALDAAADRAAASAAERRHLELGVRPDGTWSLRGLLDAVTGAALSVALEPLSAPEPAVDTGGRPVRDERTVGQRRHDALAQLVDHALDAGVLSEAGGERPHVTVTTSHAELRALHAVGVGECPPGGHLRARLEAGPTLTPAELRAVLCDARILPVVLGGAGQVLDVGRASRLFTTAQRRALAVRDQGCVWPGCAAPVARTHAHHLVHWVDGGRTDLDNAALLCPTHHRRLHRQGWTARLAANGLPELVPPVRLDPRQRPVQHHRWHLDLHGGPEAGDDP